ncbi:MAG: tetratricopeptide repeat protein [Paracoccaceae bacterium]
MRQNLYRIVTALSLMVGNSLPLAAQSEIEPLLEELKSAEKQRAVQIVREVEREWGLSGSTSVDMLLRRGHDAMEEEDWTLAIEHLTAVTDHAPDFAEGWHARATAFFQSGKIGPAIADLQTALALNPDNWNAIYGLGIVFQEMGDHVRAADAFQMTLDLHPHHENATEALKQVQRFGVGQTL